MCMSLIINEMSIYSIKKFRQCHPESKEWKLQQKFGIDIIRENFSNEVDREWENKCKRPCEGYVFNWLNVGMRNKNHRWTKRLSLGNEKVFRGFIKI